MPGGVGLSHRPVMSLPLAQQLQVVRLQPLQVPSLACCLCAEGKPFIEMSHSHSRRVCAGRRQCPGECLPARRLGGGDGASLRYERLSPPGARSARLRPCRMNSVGLLAPHSLIPSCGGTMLPCNRRLQPASTFELNGGHCRASRLSAAHHSHLRQIVAERFAADPSTVVSLTTDVSGSGVRPHL